MKSVKLEAILAHYKIVDPQIYKYMQKVDFQERLKLDQSIKPSTQAYFVSLCRSIVGQQLSGKAATAIYSKFEMLLNKDINPQSIIKTDDNKLREAGLSWSKVKYINDLAARVNNKELQLNNLSDLSDSEIIKVLTEVKGIGDWTVEMFLMFTLKRENIFSFGDLGLKKGIAKVYKIENPSKVQIEKIISKWHPYKTYGSITLWDSLEQS